MGYTKIEAIPKRISISIVGTDEIKMLVKDYLIKRHDYLKEQIRDSIRLPETDNISIDCCTEDQITFSFEDRGDKK